MNKVFLIGRLTNRPELKQAGSGQVINFNLAVDRKFKDKNGNKQTDFIQCLAWNSTANYINNYINKGDMMAIDGSVETRNYEKDGKKIYITEINCDNVKKLSVSNRVETKEENKNFNLNINSDDLPFY